MKVTDLAARYDELAARKIKKPPSFVAQTTPLHDALIEMLDRLLRLGMEGNDSDPRVRTMLRTFSVLMPSIKERFAEVPEPTVRKGLTEMADQLNRVLQTTSQSRPAQP